MRQERKKRRRAFGREISAEGKRIGEKSVSDHEGKSSERTRELPTNVARGLEGKKIAIRGKSCTEAWGQKMGGGRLVVCLQEC